MVLLETIKIPSSTFPPAFVKSSNPNSPGAMKSPGFLITYIIVKVTSSPALRTSPNLANPLIEINLAV
jgi:hypothetical protein